jgi:hypothetical protein
MGQFQLTQYPYSGSVLNALDWQSQFIFFSSNLIALEFLRLIYKQTPHF